jgi:hypothetical protein
MHFKNLTWTVATIAKKAGSIDPKPQYQRGPVWSPSKQQLLIDSIINRFDIPKIYLRYLGARGPYEYEVADGQQRLRAIWGFLDCKYPLANVRAPNMQWSGKTFKQLDRFEQMHILDFKLIIATVYEASNDDIRELFARLQKGVRLTIIP